ncbi:MAG: lysophospholipid acyltransferase family protein, partial [Candidatus Dormibacteraceae bacterium]
MIDTMIYAFLRRVIGRGLPRLYLRRKFTIRGESRVPRQGPLLVCSNHISNLDAAIVPAFLPRPDSWNMAKAEWFRSRVVGWLFSLYHAFPVVRHSPDRRSLRRAQAVLE